MRVHHLDCGTMCPVAGALLGGSVGLGRGHLVCHCLLIETERDGLVLVDTGWGADACRDPASLPRALRVMLGPRLEPGQCAQAQVVKLGFQPEDVRHIVVTHLDPDHAGGLAEFPWATVHLHRREHEAATRRRSLNALARYRVENWRHDIRWQPYLEDGDTWMGLPAVQSLRSVRADIALVPLHGHSAGHSAVAVRDGERWLLHAGDAYFHRDELVGRRPPPGLALIARVDEHDRRARLASVAALRQLAARGDIDISCAHDPVELARLVDASSSSPAAAPQRSAR
jgi:glyoxylase-like metal-dependent hydrolase (beta-lactamase superfamily II)